MREAWDMNPSENKTIYSAGVSAGVSFGVSVFAEELLQAHIERTSAADNKNLFFICLFPFYLNTAWNVSSV